MAEMEYLPGGIRERMEDLRNRRKLTLKEVSEKTGIDYSTLSRIENGNVKKVGDDLKSVRIGGRPLSRMNCSTESRIAASVQRLSGSSSMMVCRT